jgi:hypothetical protein
MPGQSPDPFPRCKCRDVSDLWAGEGKSQFSSVLSRADGVPARGDLVVVVDPDTDRVKVHWTGTIHPRTARISLFALFGALAWSQQSETSGVRSASGSGSVAGDVVIEGTCLPVHFAESA